MQIQVDQIKAHVAGPGHPHDGVEVGSVVVAQAPRVVDDPGDLQNIGIEQAQGVGVGEHEPGGVRPGGRAQGLQVHAALGIGGHVDHSEAAHGGGGRVGAVGGIGDQDLGPGWVPPVQVVFFYHQQGGELPVGPGGGLEGHLVHAGDLAQELLRPAQHLQAALDRIGALEGVDSGKTGQSGQLLVDLGIILHGAGAQGIKPVVDPVGPAAQGGVVPGQVHLGHLRQAEGRFPLQTLQQMGGRHVQRRQQVAAAAGNTLFKQQFHLSTPPEWPLPGRRSHPWCSSRWRTRGCPARWAGRPEYPGPPAPPSASPASRDRW